MACYRIEYSRKDMPNRCSAIKFAHEEKKAVKLLKEQMRKKRVDIFDLAVKIIE